MTFVATPARTRTSTSAACSNTPPVTTTPRSPGDATAADRHIDALRRPVDPVLGICAYQVRNSPFVIVYGYDDAELRVHLVIHASADRTIVDLSSVVW